MKPSRPEKIRTRDRNRIWEKGGLHPSEMASWDKEMIQDSYSQATDDCRAYYEPMIEGLREKNKVLRETARLHEGESDAHFTCIMENAKLTAQLEEVNKLCDIRSEGLDNIARDTVEFVNELYQQIAEKDHRIETLLRTNHKYFKDSFKVTFKEYTELKRQLKEKEEELKIATQYAEDWREKYLNHIRKENHRIGTNNVNVDTECDGIRKEGDK